MESKSSNQGKILYLNFNQDYKCFCVGTEDGYMIFNVEKYQRIFHRSNLVTINNIFYSIKRRNWYN